MLTKRGDIRKLVLCFVLAVIFSISLIAVSIADNFVSTTVDAPSTACQNSIFTLTSNITCETSDCGDVTATLYEESLQQELDEHKTILEQEHEDAMDDIRSRIPGLDETGSIEYFNTLNGIYLNITDEEAQELLNSPYVKEVHRNYEFKIQLNETVGIINADEVWQLDANGNNCSISGQPCLTGTGISIAIIDTGVDYTHPDLGGCFGAGCKVEDGYDFVWYDSDPMDDHGHGTHCAATAAGDGVLKGVAPNATIYAYKVLDHTGYGGSHWIAGAIERAVDPNDDGNFNDHVDIMSLSIGGRGHPDDYLSRIVDNAVNAGVIAVVAAGNNGPNNSSVSSPGNARKAITVGAVNNSDGIARFSGRGPSLAASSGSVVMKPDVVAPGVDVCAAQWDNYQSGKECIDTDHISISGTSMATPHVAGAAALLLQKNPTWTPEDIKSALRNTAVNIPDLRFEDQGAGRIDVLAAISLNTVPPIAIVDGGMMNGTIDITGSAKSDDIYRYILYYGEGREPVSWTEITTSTSSIDEGVLYSGFDTTILDNGAYSLRLVVEDTNGLTNEARNRFFVFNIDYTFMQSGWPVFMGSGPENGTGSGPTFADLDQDGYLEIIVGGYDGYLYAWHHDGTLVAGWPQQVVQVAPLSLTEVYTPAVGDIDNDGNPEIVVSASDGYIHAFSSTGSLLAGWPVEVDFTKRGMTFGPVSLADVDGDSALDIVYGSFRDRQVYVLDHQGNNVPGWPQNFSESNELLYPKGNPPVIADIDGDGSDEIIAPLLKWSDSPYWQATLVYAWHSNGTIVDGWPNVVSNLTGTIWFQTAAAGDVDGDDSTDIIVMNGIEITVVDKDGNTLPGSWPVGGGWLFEPNIGFVLADFEDDGRLEIIYVQRNNISILNHDGTLRNAIDFSETFGYVIDGLAVSDLDNDGKEDIVGVFYDSFADYPGLGFRPVTEVFAWNDQGQLLNNFPLEVFSGSRGTPIVADLDGDGDVELGVGEHNFFYNNFFYVWDLPAAYNQDQSPWPMFGHDAENTGFLKTYTELDSCPRSLYKGDFVLVNDVVAIDTCFTMYGDDITLNCNGHTISGSGIGSGVKASGRNNIIIKNCNISGFERGINFSDTDDALITKNTIADSDYGIYLDTDSTNNLIYNNLLNNSNENAYDSGTNNWNTSYDCSVTGQNIIGEDCIGGNYFATPAGTGWSETYLCNDVDFDGICNDPYSIPGGSNVDNLPLAELGAGSSVICGEMIVSDITLTTDLNCPGDALIIRSNGVKIDCAGHLINGSGSGVGIGLAWDTTGFEQLEIENCTIANFSTAIALGNSNDSVITGNTLVDNSWGVFQGGTGNIIYNNYFDNVNNANDGGTNSWNTTYDCSVQGQNILGEDCLGGNYWLDPYGTSFSLFCNDIDSDGICDESYTIPGPSSSIDHLPLKMLGTGTLNCGSAIITNRVLTSDLVCSGTGLTIGAPGVTLDCNGSSITFTGTPGIGDNGIYNNGYDDVVIKNCIIDNFHRGIYLVNVDNGELDNNTIINAANAGLMMETCTNNDILGNTFDNDGTGIHLEGNNEYNNFTSNLIINNDGTAGVYVYDSSYNDFISNSASNNAAAAIFVELGSYNTFDSNIINDNDQVGIQIGSGAGNSTITNNEINRNKWGISLGDYDIVVNNTITDSNTHGIMSFSGNDNNINSNTIIGSGDHGIYMSSSDNNLIFNNHLNNTNNAFDDSINDWNTSYDCSITEQNILSEDCIGGNFYATPTGTGWSESLTCNDADFDGICNNAYSIPGGTNVDYLPLAELGTGGLLCADNDFDGYGACPACGTENACDYDGDDCDDNNASINPGQTEICNGLDDDCNASTADGSSETWLGDPTSCGVGECASTGILECTGGAQTDTCSPGSSSAELCDGLDNDCDGTVTDDGENETWYGDPTSCGIGECASTGTFDCIGSIQTDTCSPGSSSAELCDGLDNDCDGTITDDGENETWYGDPTSCGIGECASTGTFDCSGGVQTDTCSPNSPSVELCDGLDNDCDGTVTDDGENETWYGDPTSCGVGECASTGTFDCSGGVQTDTCSPNSPSAEICNDLLDNDCDGDSDCDDSDCVGGAFCPVQCGDTISSDVNLTTDLLNCPVNGIMIDGANDITLDCAGHRITNADYDNQDVGIWISGPDNVTIKNCIVEDFAHGIQISSQSSNCDVFNNTVKHSFSSGMRIISSSRNIITNNTISGGHAYGIRLEYSSWYNNLTNNEIFDNEYEGISIYINSIGNLIYNNYLNNSNNAFDDSTNDWNTTYDCISGLNILGEDCIGGNYYATPTGTGWSETASCNDADSDGICNNAYSIPGGSNVDHLPLTTIDAGAPLCDPLNPDPIVNGEITDCCQLQAMKNDVNGDYILTTNINCSDTVNWNSGAGFEPVGISPNYFAGTFDGQGHTITNLFINRPTSTYAVGLFSISYGSGIEIKNVGLENVNIVGSVNTGGLVANSNGLIQNSYTTGQVSGVSKVGGLVANHEWGYSISNSYSTCEVTGDTYVGGLVANSAGDIVNSYATGSVTGNSQVGGLAGYNVGNILNSYEY
jgi:parallel beta-helix repeat protein